VHYALMHRNLGGYDGSDRAPLTTAKTEMIDAGLTDLEDWMIGHADQWPLCNEVVCIDDIVNTSLPPHLAKRHAVTAHIKTALRAHFKGKPLGQVRIGGHQRVSLWAINGAAKMTDRQAADAYLRCAQQGGRTAEELADDDL
jgi:hypothetical protein